MIYRLYLINDERGKMEYNALLEVLNQYGLWVVLGLEFAEYLNLPGFPATPILMAIGVWARVNQVLIPALIISIIGAQIGTMLLYAVGRLFGKTIMTRYYRRFPKHRQKIEKYVDRIENEGPHLLLIVRLIPVLRTLITIPSGMTKVNVHNFFWYSLAGIAIWNGLFILAGSTIVDVVTTVMQ